MITAKSRLILPAVLLYEFHWDLGRARAANTTEQVQPQP